jgi:cation transport regulator ChaC
MRKCLYFAYGSNIDPERLKGRSVNFLHAEHGALEDYALSFNKRSKKFFDRGFANVTPSVGEHVEGVLYQVTEEDLLKLDKFEGCPTHYERVSLPIVAKTGLVTAYVYVAKKEWIVEGLKPTKEYLNHLMKGKEFFTEPYFNRLKTIPTTDI